MKQRVISAVVALILIIPFIYFGGMVYNVGVSVLAMVAFVEILMLKKSHKDIPIIPMCIAIAMLVFFVLGDSIVFELNYVKIIILTLGLLLPTIFYKNDKYITKDAFYLIGIVVFLAMAFRSFIIVRESGIKTFLYLVLIPIITDSFAYFLGVKFGKHKMCPKISPKKSWEGAASGLVFGTIIPSLIYYILMNTFSIKILLGTLVLSTMGQLGDLIFSKIKRENEIKDFSNLMPGHGGALDRLDSTIVIFMTYILLRGVLF